MSDVKHLITALEQFIKTKTVENTQHGLCVNFNLDNYMSIKNIKSIMQSWPDCSNDWVYPVPSSDTSYTAIQYYTICSIDEKNGLYQNNQLSYRLSLAQHIINSVKE